MNKTHILIIDVTEADARRICEQLEGSIFNTDQELLTKLKEKGIEDIVENVSSYLLTDFMDLVNNEVLDNLSQSFISYIQIKE